MQACLACREEPFVSRSRRFVGVGYIASISEQLTLGKYQRSLEIFGVGLVCVMAAAYPLLSIYGGQEKFCLHFLDGLLAG